jgi:uncharacterized damage-inducible protein DinB
MTADLATVRTLLDHSDWSNRTLLEAALPLEEAELERDMQIGPGSMRRILLHIYNGEAVWLKRWQGNAETKWPSEQEKIGVRDLAERFERCWVERDGFFAGLMAIDVARVQPYRDSKGTLYTATLGDMLLQGVLHSKHHQAQAVNALKRLGASWPELDYMYRVRRATAV